MGQLVMGFEHLVNITGSPEDKGQRVREGEVGMKGA